MPNHVLVIGGTGFIGGLVGRVLRAAGHDVSVLSRGARGGPAAGLVADRTDAAALARALGGSRFDATLDFAAYDRLGVDTLAGVPGFLPGRYVLISSGQACLVTTAPPMPYREEDGDHPLKPEPPLGTEEHPQWAYGAGKRAAEEAAAALGRSGRWETLILRLPVVLGAGDTSLRTWGYVERFLDGGPVLLPDGGARDVRFLWVEDVARALLAILGRGPLPSALYHLAQPDIVPLASVLARMAALAKREVEFVPVDDAQLAAAGIGRRDCSPLSGRWVSVLDPSRAEREWGFRGTPLDGYLESVVRAHLDRPPEASSPGYERRDREVALARRLKSGVG